MHKAKNKLHKPINVPQLMTESTATQQEPEPEIINDTITEKRLRRQMIKQQLATLKPKHRKMDTGATQYTGNGNQTTIKKRPRILFTRS